MSGGFEELRETIKDYYGTAMTLGFPIVKCFGKTKIFQVFWKKRLDKMVAKLQKEGYESTPYID